MRAQNLAAAGVLRRHTKCPYQHYVTADGRLIIEGEDFGDAETAFAEGRALSGIVRLWHEVSLESGTV